MTFYLAKEMNWKRLWMNGIDTREYRVTMAEELRNLPIQGDYVTPPP